MLLATFLGALPAAGQGASGTDYRIGPKDLLDIRVFEVPELNVQERVSEQGMVELPLIGEVEADGLTETEFAARLKQILEDQLLQRASVAVEVLEYRSKPITIIGAVKAPGPLAFSGRWSLLEALTAAGGLTEGHGGVVHVLRRASNGLSAQIAIDLDELMLRADSTLNIPLFANDLINVPAAVDVTVFCLGEVRSPGALVFQSTERITLLTAIARAGGLTDRAARKIVVKRPGRNGGETELEVDYKRVLAGRDPDLELQEGDIVVVKESFF